jgi:hypothetical protein
MNLAVALTLDSSCSAAQRPKELAANASATNIRSKAPASTLEHSADYVIAAGLRWLVTLDSDTLLRKLLVIEPKLLPQANVRSFEHSVGVELARLDNVSIAGFDYSTLYVVRGEIDQQATRNRFAARVAVDPTASKVGSGTLLTGLFGDDIAHYASLDSNTSLWSDGDPSTAKAALLLAERKLSRSPAALRGAALSMLPNRCMQGQAVAFVPGPINLRSVDGNVSLVLDATLALSIRATIEDETLLLHICWVGDFHNDGVARTSAVLESILASRFATLMGLTQAERSGTFTQNGELVEVDFRWAATKVLERIQGVLSLDLQTLLAPPT